MAKKSTCSKVPHKWFPDWRRRCTVLTLGIIFENVPSISEAEAVSKHAAFIGECQVGRVTLTRVRVEDQEKFVVPVGIDLETEVSIGLLAERAILTDLQLEDIDVEREAATKALSTNKAEVERLRNLAHDTVDRSRSRFIRAQERYDRAQIDESVADNVLLDLRRKFFAAKRSRDRASERRDNYYEKANVLEKAPL